MNPQLGVMIPIGPNGNSRGPVGENSIALTLILLCLVKKAFSKAFAGKRECPGFFTPASGSRWLHDKCVVKILSAKVAMLFY